MDAHNFLHHFLRALAPTNVPSDENNNNVDNGPVIDNSDTTTNNTLHNNDSDEPTTSFHYDDMPPLEPLSNDNYGDVGQGTAIRHDDVSSLPNIPSVDPTTPNPSLRVNGRRARVEDDEDDDRDRRHPSERIRDPIDHASISAAGSTDTPEHLTPPAQPPPRQHNHNHQHFTVPRPPWFGGRGGTTLRASFNVPGVTILMGENRARQDDNPNNLPRIPSMQPFDTNANTGGPSGSNFNAGNGQHGGPAPNNPRGMMPGPTFVAIDLDGDAAPNGIRDFFNFLGAAGAFGMGPERPDPERAQKIVDALETVPIGLAKRLEALDKVGKGSGEGSGDTMCAICWDQLLDEDGGKFGTSKEMAQEASHPLPTENITSEQLSSHDLPSAIAESSSARSQIDSSNPEIKYPKIVSLPCAHIFHATCLIPWFSRPRQTTCPTCRFNLDPEGLIPSSFERQQTGTSNPDHIDDSGAAGERERTGPVDNNAQSSEPGITGAETRAQDIRRRELEELPGGVIDDQPQATGATNRRTEGQQHHPPAIITLGIEVFFRSSPGPDDGDPDGVAPAGDNMNAGPSTTPPGIGVGVPPIFRRAVRLGSASNGAMNPAGTSGASAMPPASSDAESRRSVNNNINAAGSGPFRFTQPPLPHDQTQGPGERLFPLPQNAENGPQGMFMGEAIDFGSIVMGPEAGDAGTDTDMEGDTEEMDVDEVIGGFLGVDVGQEGQSQMPGMATGQQAQRAQEEAGDLNAFFTGFMNQMRAQGHQEGGRERDQPAGVNVETVESPNIPPAPPSANSRTQGTQPNPTPPGNPRHGRPNMWFTSLPGMPGGIQVAQGTGMLRRVFGGVPRPDGGDGGQVHGTGVVPQQGSPQALQQNIEMREQATGRTPENDNNRNQEGGPGSQGALQQFLSSLLARAFVSQFMPPNQDQDQDRTPRPNQGDNQGQNNNVNAGHPHEHAPRIIVNGVPVNPADFWRGQANNANDDPHNDQNANVNQGFGGAGPFPGIPFAAGGVGPGGSIVFPFMPSGPPRPRGPKRVWTPPPAPGPTLRQRIERREREAGLRCSDMSCGIGPSDEEPFTALTEAARRQLSIRAPQDEQNIDEERMVCPHTFHPACLVSAARVAMMGEEAVVVGGDVEVACSVCRGVGNVRKGDWDEGVQALE